MSAPVFLFEDHCESYVRWKEAGLKNVTVIHLDAHLDLRDESFLPGTIEKIINCKTARQLEVYRKNKDILWDGFHPGNYLYPAVLDETVSHLIWVIPPHLPEGEDLLPWLRGELQNWKDVTLQEYSSLEYSGKMVTGKLCGVDFTTCFLKDLKCNDPLICWDVDLDFCFDSNDIPWIAPGEIADLLYEKAPNPAMITIAYSVNGGYTAPEQKFLGDLIYRAINGSITSEIKQDCQRMKKADLQIQQKKYDQAIPLLKQLEKDKFFQPYASFRLSKIYKKLKDNAAAEKYARKVRDTKPELILPPYDQAMIHFRRKEYDQALSLLLKSARIDDKNFLMSHFISAVIYMKKKEYKKAGVHWDEIINHKAFPGWSDGVRAHVLYVAGLTRVKAGKYKSALNLLSRSINVYEENFKAYIHRARAYRNLGDFKRAARDLRRYIYEKPDNLETLEAHYQLAQVYGEMNKTALKKAELKNLERKDVTGFYKMKAILEKTRSMR